MSRPLDRFREQVLLFGGKPGDTARNDFSLFIDKSAQFTVVAVIKKRNLIFGRCFTLPFYLLRTRGLLSTRVTVSIVLFFHCSITNWTIGMGKGGNNPARVTLLENGYGLLSVVRDFSVGR